MGKRLRWMMTESGIWLVCGIEDRRAGGVYRIDYLKNYPIGIMTKQKIDGIVVTN